MDVQLTCYSCGSSAEFSEGSHCECGEPYWVETDPTGFEWPDSNERSMWRYRDLLPGSPSPGLCAEAGGTPMARAPRLDEEIGATVHVKYEGVNPTGSFKDRGSAVGVSVAAAEGYEAVGTVSHGNMARSMAAHAASAGLDCVILVPADIPDSRLSLMANHDPTILRVEGEYDGLYRESLRIEQEHSIAFVNSDAPLRTAGQKTTGLEIAEAFAPEVPDAVVVPASSGGHASAIWKAFLELSAAGLVDAMPELYFVQTAACAPIAEAWSRGEDTFTPVEAGETVAYSIANPNPPSGNRVLAAARDTDGAVIGVDDEEILDARRALSERAGLFVETASATTLAGARKLAEKGAFDSASDVVIVPTGTGFTEREVDPRDVDADTVTIADLESRISGLLG